MEMRLWRLLWLLSPGGTRAEFGTKEGVVISLVDDAEQWPGAQESSQAAPAQDDPGAGRARVPLARLQQRLYGFQQPVVQTSPVLSAGCKAGFAAQPAVLRVHLAPEKSDTLSMVNNFLFYSHARLLAEQVGWGFEALVRNTTFGKGRMSWAPYFPGAPLRLHGRSASRQRQGVVVWAIRDGEDPLHEVDGARCPPAEIHDCQLAARVRAAGCARIDVQPPGDWGMDRFVPFKAQLQRWFAPKAPAHLPPPSASDVVIHLRKCWMYKKSRSSGATTPSTATDMRSRNYFCKLNFMTDPPLGFFDRVIADIKSRREVKRVWVVTGHRQGHRNCLEHVIPYLQEKWGAELFTAGENAIDDWIFLRRATGPIILTGSFGTMAAWLGAASEIHMPVAGTNKKRVLWDDARVQVHDIEDEKYFGAYSNALGRFIFREGRAVARNNTDCYQLQPTRRHKKGEKREGTSGRDPAGTFVGSTGHSMALGPQAILRHCGLRY